VSVTQIARADGAGPGNGAYQDGAGYATGGRRNLRDAVLVLEGSTLCDKKKCDHRAGWFVKERVDILIYTDGRISFNNQHGKVARIRATCNLTDCLEPRTIMIPQMRVGQAKIAKRKYRPRPDTKGR